MVGIATGMFTLRDHVLPRESGVAIAMTDAAYQQAVSVVCDERNAAERDRGRAIRRLRERLRHARSVDAQRVLLLDVVRRTENHASHALAGLLSLEPPHPHTDLHRDTGAAWNRTVERLRVYAARLDRAANERAVRNAIDRYARERERIRRDSLRVVSGLRRLGGPGCDIARSPDTPTVPLPELASATGEPTHAGGQPDTAPSSSDGRGTGPDTAPSQRAPDVAPTPAPTGPTGLRP